MAKSTEASELKFLLELVNCHDYRNKLTKIEKIGSSDLRNVSCAALLSKGYIECNKEIFKFVVEGAGKELLKKGTESLPLNLDSRELAVLKACVKEATPGQLGKKVPANERQSLLRNMAGKGLIKISKESINEVWLSAQGKTILTGRVFAQKLLDDHGG